MTKKLTDITPSKFRCGDASACCPAVFRSAQDTYFIVGKMVEVNEHPQLRRRVGADEMVIEIAAELLDGAVKGSADSRE